MAIRDEDFPPHLRRAPAERPQLPADPPEDAPLPREQNPRTPPVKAPPQSHPYLRRNAGIASPPPYERN